MSSDTGADGAAHLQRLEHILQGTPRAVGQLFGRWLALRNSTCSASRATTTRTNSPPRLCDSDQARTVAKVVLTSPTIVGVTKLANFTPRSGSKALDGFEQGKRGDLIQVVVIPTPRPEKRRAMIEGDIQIRLHHAVAYGGVAGRGIFSEQALASMEGRCAALRMGRSSPIRA